VLAGALTDPFAGYDSRVHGQVGASRILVRGLGTELRGEVGADLAREDYVAGVRPRTAMITAARQLLGISHAFSTGVTFTDQVEIYENVVDPSDVRLLNTGAFSAKLANALSLRLSHTLVFDNVPVEGFRKLDQTTLATFVATLL
jgi:putative salt-induced outer membrane protein YdiY